MLRERDRGNLLWSVQRARSVLFVGPELGGSRLAATAGVAQPARTPTSTDRRRKGNAA